MSEAFSIEIHKDQSKRLAELELQFTLLFLPQMNDLLRWFERQVMHVRHERIEFYHRTFLKRSDWKIKSREYSTTDTGERVDYTLELQVEWGKVDEGEFTEACEITVSISTMSPETCPQPTKAEGTCPCKTTVVVNSIHNAEGPFFNQDSIDSIMEYIIFDMGS